MTNYKWTDNPTEADVSTYNPDVLNECLMHLKYNNIPSSTTKYCFNDGNTDTSGNSDLVNVNLSTNIEYASPGEYTFTAPVTGYYSVIMVGGGGSSASGLTSLSTISYAGGGSGAAFVGEVYLSAGVHSVSVGSAGGENNTSIDNIIIAGGGGNASLINYNLNVLSQNGGVVTVNGTTRNVSVNESGNAGGFSNGNIPQNGGASVYHGFGKGADSGKGSGASCGYFSIKLKSENSNISYKVGGVYPLLTGTLANGEKFFVNGINSDNAEILSDGTYIKFVGKNGSSELIKNSFFRQQSAPSSPANGDVWFDIGTEPCEAKQWNGSQWVSYEKIPLCKFTVQNSSIISVFNFPYNQNGYNINMLSHYGKPSAQYKTLQLPASGSTIIAPFDGFISVLTDSSKKIILTNMSAGNFTSSVQSASNIAQSAFIPCRKNDNIKITYDITTLNYFRCYSDNDLT